MQYKLLVKETQNKSARYHYTIVDESGKVTAERKSNREYAACLYDGSMFFGRIDLIGKGEHGRLLRFLDGKGEPHPAIAYLETSNTQPDGI
jgi:hypothetical protein